MPAYAAAIPCPPRTLTEFEQAALRKITGKCRDHPVPAGIGT
jgi:hypothetical protein